MSLTDNLSPKKIVQGAANVGYYGIVCPAIAALPSPVSTWAFEHFPKSLEPDGVKPLSGLEKAVGYAGTSSAVELLAGLGFSSYAVFVDNSVGTIGGACAVVDGAGRYAMSILRRTLWSGFNLRPAGVIEGPLMTAYTIAKRVWEDAVRPYGHVPQNHHNGTG